MGSGLYHPDEFRDNCGFGLIAHTEGKKSHGLLQKAIKSLTCMTHRGGIAADGRTGDGCGLLVQIPDTFFRTSLSPNVSKSASPLLCRRHGFLQPDQALTQRARHALEAELDCTT